MRRQIPAARVVIIGGGIAGCSAAYHLAERGWRDVVVLERANLSAGTTWHSTGNMETYRADPLIFEMVRYAAATYPRVAAQSGLEIGWRTVGRVMYTDREERWEVLRTLPELGRARGIEIELLSPQNIVRRLPIIAGEGLIGGIWVPSDARVNPTDAVTALARAARRLGVRVEEHAQVLHLVVRNGAVQGVATAEGVIACESVVIAAGLWSDDVARSGGLSLPLHALEHQYVITKPCGIARDLPLFLSYDDQLYGREETGGLIVGSLDDHAVPVSTADLPGDCAHCLLNERWDQFEPYLATALRRFPVLRAAGVKMLLNGPESFTADGQMLLGPIPGATGVYAVCGFNSNGMALAPAAGRYIAEWIVEGAPSADVAPLDVRRFSAVQSTPGFIRERVTEIPGYHCRLHAADTDYQTARGIRRSPLHDCIAAAGGHFASINGWERALWCDEGHAGMTWAEAVASECGCAADGVLVIDRSADTKLLLEGPGVGEWLDQVAPTRFGGHPGTDADVRHRLLAGSFGQIEAHVRVLSSDAARCLVMVSPDQDTRLREWLRCTKPPADVRVLDSSTSHACLEFSGPRRAELIDALRASAIDRREDCVNDTTLLSFPCDRAVELWNRLRVLGVAFALKVAGHFAEEAMRIRRGVPVFGREMTPAMLVTEAGGSPSPQTSCAVPTTHRPRVLASFSSSMPRLGFGPREVILGPGGPVGELTSRIRLAGWPATLCLGWLDPGHCGGSVAVVSDGRRWQLDPRPTHWRALT